MVRSLRIFGMGLFALLLWVGYTQNGLTNERYTVKPGDTLYEISKMYGVGIKLLKKANGLTGDSIKTKQVLVIPAPKGKKADSEEKRVSDQAMIKYPEGALKKTPDEMISYTVKRGDTLVNLSEKAGVSVGELMKMNNLHHSSLKIDQVLLLPKPSNPEEKEGEELEEEDAAPEDLQIEEGKAEPAVLPSLGKWNNPEERNLFVRVVKTFLGVPYKYGGSTLRGIDCSAFVKRIYEIFNVQLPRTVREQFTIGKKVGKEELEKGDLVFFKRRGNLGHVGIYIGENQFIHASSHNREIRIDHLDTPYYSKRFLKGVRVKELDRES